MKLNISTEVLALSLLTAGEQAHSFSAFMPSAFTANNWILDGTPEEIRQRVAMWRKGYRPALAFGLGLSAVVSVIAKSPLPFLFAAGAGVTMGTMYERILPEEYRLKLEDWPTLLITGEVQWPELPAGRTAPLLPEVASQSTSVLGF